MNKNKKGTESPPNDDEIPTTVKSQFLRKQPSYE